MVTDTSSFDPSASAAGNELLVEQRHALSAIAAVATSFVEARGSHMPGKDRLQQLVQTACQCLPLAQHAAVVAMGNGIELLVGANDPVMDAWVRAESALGHGPLHDVLTRRSRVVISDELHADLRWGDFADLLARRTVVHSVLAVGFHHYGSPVVLALCSTWPFAFDSTAPQYAEVLTAIYALAERATA